MADLKALRSRNWFNNPDKPDMTAIYVERFMNYGITRQELMSGRPMVCAMREAFLLSFLCIRFRKVADDRRRAWIATWLISGWSRFCMGIRSTESC